MCYKLGVSQSNFINRKIDHLQLSLLDEVEANECSTLDRIELVHESMPELDLAEVSIETSFLESVFPTPFYIAGMTAGHEQAEVLNSRLAAMASERGWLMGVGSQRREVDVQVDTAFSDSAVANLVKRFPKLKLMANLGMSQLIELSEKNELSKLFTVLDRMQASLLAIHLNPLQEAIQEEGTPNFKGSFSALEQLLKSSPVPVTVKETGCGMSEKTLQKLSALPLFGIDVSGLGGTHWGRIEGKRSPKTSVSARAGETFQNWGIPTVESLLNARSVKLGSTELWASGGVRSGLDAAKLISLGASRVGFARPALQAAINGENALDLWMKAIEKELKIALFCTESSSIKELVFTKVRINN